MQHVVNKNYIERNNIFKTLSIASRNKRLRPENKKKQDAIK